MSNLQEAESFDFHCHVDLYPDPLKVIQECEAKKAFTLAVTTTPKAWKQNLEWTKSSKLVQPALGLHPELVGERFNELGLIEQYIDETCFIGETGLDGSLRYKSSWKVQKEIFCKILTMSCSSSPKVISIHSREASKEVIDILKPYTEFKKILCILHWYTGTLPDLKRALAIGCYFSINHKMLNTQKGCSIVRQLPLNRILTETDGPFTSTQTKVILPTDTVETIRSIASIKNMTTE